MAIIICLVCIFKYTGMQLHDILLEADIEEQKGVRWKKSILKSKLIGFHG